MLRQLTSVGWSMLFDNLVVVMASNDYWLHVCTESAVGSVGH